MVSPLRVDRKLFGASRSAISFWVKSKPAEYFAHLSANIGTTARTYNLASIRYEKFGLLSQLCKYGARLPVDSTAFSLDFGRGSSKPSGYGGKTCPNLDRVLLPANLDHHLYDRAGS